MARSSNKHPKDLEGSIVYFSIDTDPDSYEPVRGPYFKKPHVHEKSVIIEKYKLVKVSDDYVNKEEILYSR